jgi:hypothetical protein
MMDYWTAQGLIRAAQLDASLLRQLTTSSSPQEWAQRGAQFLDKANYRAAVQCVERAQQVQMATWAKGLLEEQQARQQAAGRAARLAGLQKAADLMLSVAGAAIPPAAEQAVLCLEHAEQWAAAAQACLAHRAHVRDACSRAGELFVKVGAAGAAKAARLSVLPEAEQPKGVPAMGRPDCRWPASLCMLHHCTRGSISCLRASLIIQIRAGSLPRRLHSGRPEAALRVHYGRKDLQAAGQLLVSWQQQGSLPPGQLLALRKAHVLKLAHHCHVTRDKEGFIRAVQMHPDAGVRRR